MKRTSNSSCTFERQLSPAQELTRIKATVKRLKQHPDEGRAMMIRAGICTADGKLTKAYGGKA